MQPQERECVFCWSRWGAPTRTQTCLGSFPSEHPIPIPPRTPPHLQVYGSVSPIPLLLALGSRSFQETNHLTHSFPGMLISWAKKAITPKNLTNQTQH